MKRDVSRLRMRKLLARCAAAKLNTTSRLVLLVLQAHEDAGGASYPSQSMLAAECGVDHKTARAAIVALERAGLVQVKRGKFFVYTIVNTERDTNPDDAFRDLAAEVWTKRHPVGASGEPLPTSNDGECGEPVPTDVGNHYPHDATQVGSHSPARGEPFPLDVGNSAPQGGEPFPPKNAEKNASEERRKNGEPELPALVAPVPPAAPLKLSPVDAPAPKPKRTPKPKPEFLPPLAFSPAEAVGYATETSGGRVVAGDDRAWPKSMFVQLSGLIRVHRTPETWRAFGAWLAAGGDAFRGHISTGELSSSWLPGSIAKAIAWDAAGRGPIDDRRPSTPRKGPVPVAVNDPLVAEATRTGRVVHGDPIGDAMRRQQQRETR